ncbi:MAG: hypothetical protein MHMPM18_004804, partial [Marteilia pararefringens]
IVEDDRDDNTCDEPAQQDDGQTLMHIYHDHNYNLEAAQQYIRSEICTADEFEARKLV